MVSVNIKSDTMNVVFPRIIFFFGFWVQYYKSRLDFMKFG